MYLSVYSINVCLYLYIMLGCGGQISQGMYVCTECMYGMYVCMYACTVYMYVCMYAFMYVYYNG